MKRRLLAGLGVFVLTSSWGHAQTLNIDHQPVGCAAAEKFPRLTARFAPADTVATARVLFQGAITQEWYSVAMKPEGAVYSGVLPKPKKSLKAFRYYIEVTDKSLGTSRTAEYTTSVAASPRECNGKVMAATLGSASVILQGPAGAAALPAGFASTGVVVGSAAGSGSAAGAVGASAAGGGGGLGTTALVLGGVAVAGGAVAVGVSMAGGESYAVFFSPAISILACGEVASPFLGGPVFFSPNSSGNFDTVWSSATPVVRAVGQVTPTTFQATLTCTNGGGSGSTSATGSNGSYSGTFEFGPQRGQVMVTKQ